MTQDQNHPLYMNDRDRLNMLISKSVPDGSDLVDLARLFIRYEDFPGCKDIMVDLEKLLRLWNLNRDELNKRTRQLWEEGFNPSAISNEAIGSGFDTSDSGNT